MSKRVVGEPILGQPTRRPDTTPESRSADLEQLFRDHRERLTRLASAIVFDLSRAEDVVQDAFAGLSRRQGDVSNPEGYLQRSVVNLSIKVLRRRRVAERHRPDRPPVAGIPEIDETWIAVRELPARQRAVVALRYWEDLSEADIADVLDWPTGTVKSTLHRALNNLKKEIGS